MYLFTFYLQIPLNHSKRAKLNSPDLQQTSLPAMDGMDSLQALDAQALHLSSPGRWLKDPYRSWLNLFSSSNLF